MGLLGFEAAGPDFEAAGPGFKAAGPDLEAAGPDSYNIFLELRSPLVLVTP